MPESSTSKPNDLSHYSPAGAVKPCPAAVPQLRGRAARAAGGNAHLIDLPVGGELLRMASSQWDRPSHRPTGDGCNVLHRRSRVPMATFHTGHVVRSARVLAIGTRGRAQLSPLRISPGALTSHTQLSGGCATTGGGMDRDSQYCNTSTSRRTAADTMLVEFRDADGSAHPWNARHPVERVRPAVPGLA